MKRSVEVKILNHRYLIKSDENDEYVDKVIEYVNRKIDETIERTKMVAAAQVAVLTALNIADDYLKLKREVNEIEYRSKALVGAIDDRAGGLG